MKNIFNYNTLCISLLVLLLSTQNAHAQIVNCNAFLKGNYIEAGVNWNGAFGSSTKPPIGFHPQMPSSLYNTAACGGALSTDTSLAFVADPDKNGWGAGTPAYFGDYLLPGGPQEGWSIMADGTQYNCWNHDASLSDTLTPGLISSIMNYSDTLGVKHVTTQAILGGYLYITQFIALDTSKLFLNITVLIENSSLATISNIYYMRTINPHNDQTLSSISATKNKIDYCLPDTLNRTVVSARGTAYSNAYIALATQDYRATGFICKTSTLPNSTTIDNIFSGDADYMVGHIDSSVSNTALGLIYNLGSLSSGGGVYFNFIYAFRSDVIDSNLNTVDTHLVVHTPIQSTFEVNPNPVLHSFNISGLQKNDHVTLHDMTGRKLNDAITTTGNGTFSINGIEKGVYLLLITNENGVIIGRKKILHI